LNLVAGNTYDLRVGKDGRSWNFFQADDWRRVRQEIARDMPYMVIGGPPCTAFSNFNVHINYKRANPAVVKRKRAEGRILLTFAM